MRAHSGRLALVRIVILLAWLCVVTTYAEALRASWETVIFYDDFAQPDCTPPDQNKWVINQPGNWWWVQGRSHFPEPSTPGAILPHVQHNALVIEHHLYNALDSNHTTFVGGEISTRGHYSFPPTQAYRFEARVRSGVAPPPNGNGLVSSFFLYGFDGSKSDEIDYEFLSNETNKYSPNQDAVHLTTWNESQQDWVQRWPTGLDLTAWNVFRIYWYPDPLFPEQQRVDWTWLDPANGEVLLHSKTASFVPDESMDLYFNFWAATNAWLKAYSSPPDPVSDPNPDQVYRYEIDYVEVRVPEPATASLTMIMAVCLVGYVFRRGTSRLLAGFLRVARGVAPALK